MQNYLYLQIQLNIEYKRRALLECNSACKLSITTDSKSKLKGVRRETSLQRLRQSS